jgi:predicted nucleotidyltransferase component of viral defense system
MIPLILRIKRSNHKEIARAQDLIVEEVYKAFNNAVLHGGTSIWRCYSGNRFSEDVDMYITKDIKKIDELFSGFERKGFVVEKKRVMEHSIFSNLRFNRTIVRFEALFKKVDGKLKEYECVEGNLITVYTLNPEEIIKEKANAYKNRLKIRDLYDIFFLLRHVKDKKAIKNELNKLIDKFKEPVDKDDLKILILEGLIPGVDKMIEYIKHYS